MEWKERDVHAFCFADNPKNCFRKTFSPLDSLHERAQLAAARAKPLCGGERAAEPPQAASLPLPYLPAQAAPEPAGRSRIRSVPLPTSDIPLHLPALVKRSTAHHPPALLLSTSAQTIGLPQHEAAVPLCLPRHAFFHPSSKVTSPPKLFLWLFSTIVNILANCLVNIPRLNSFKCMPIYYIKVRRSNAGPFV